MLGWPAILAKDGDFSSELLYVIAILILAGIGAIADKIKQKMAGESKPPAKQPGPREVPRSEIRVEEPPRRPAPPRPAAPQRPQQQRQAPRPPVVWEAPQPRQPYRPQAPPRPRPATPRPPQERRVQPEAAPTSAAARSVVSVAPTVAGDVGALQGRPAPTQLAARQVGEKTGLVSERDVGPPTARPAHAAEVKHPGIEWLSLTRADLPRAVILSEILSPPIALREQDRLF